MIARLFGFLALPLILIGLVWLVAVIYFQQSAREIDADGIVLWFVLLPLGAVALWFVGKLVWRLATRPAAAPPADAAAGAAAAPAPVEDPALRLQLAIISAELHAPAGESADALLPGIVEGKTQPGLSERLLDQDGLPVKAAASEALDTAEALAWVEKYVAAHPDAQRSAAPAEDAARLIALLAGPLERALESLAAIAPLPPADDKPASQAAAAAKRPVLTKVFAPAPWGDLVSSYVRERAAPLEGFAIGMVRVDAERPELQRDALRVADAFCAGSKGAHTNAVLMIVACDSLVSADQVAALESRNELFAAHNQAGYMPGEAAAVVVALPAEQAPAEPAPLARLHRAAFGQRQKPVNASGRVEADYLQSLAALSLGHAQQAAKTICALVSDCDHRNAWASESAQFISTALPELDPVGHHLALGRALGHVGEAASALALALAASHTHIESKPLLLASMNDPRARSLVALSPWQAAAN